MGISVKFQCLVFNKNEDNFKIRYQFEMKR